MCLGYIQVLPLGVFCHKILGGNNILFYFFGKGFWALLFRWGGGLEIFTGFKNKSLLD